VRKRDKLRQIRNSKTLKRSWARREKRLLKLLKKNMMRPSRKQSRQLLNSRMLSMIMRRPD
jgi:hypothetical protein